LNRVEHINSGNSFQAFSLAAATFRISKQPLIDLNCVDACLHSRSVEYGLWKIGLPAMRCCASRNDRSVAKRFVTRWQAGDDSVLRRDIAQVMRMGQTGSGSFAM
jgi:hypothetical protein